MLRRLRLRDLTSWIALGPALMGTTVFAHSWIEEMQLIGTNGSYVGDRGYPRGYMARTDPGFNGFSDEWMLPSPLARNVDGTVRTRLNASDYLCHPSQRSTNYSASYPMLQATPGDYVAIKYLENGHVTLPWNITGKPAGSGTVFVFGTTQPDVNGEMIANVMQWTADGSGGDKRGFLMAAQDFDDGRCHQLNCGYISQQRQLLYPDHVLNQPTSTVEQWCETDLQIPANTAPGQLTIYWIWQWPTAPNADCNLPSGKDEYYTSCADIEILPASSASLLRSAPDVHTLLQDNPQTSAVSTYASRTAILATPSILLMSNGTTIGSTPTPSSAFLAACTSSASAIVADKLVNWPSVYVPNSCPVLSTFGVQAAAAQKSAYVAAAATYAGQRKAAFAQAGLAMPMTTVSSAAAVSTSSAVMPSSSTSTSIGSAGEVLVSVSVSIAYVTVTVSVALPASSIGSPGQASFASSSTSSSLTSATSGMSGAALSSTTSASASALSQSTMVANGVVFSKVIIPGTKPYPTSSNTSRSLAVVGVAPSAGNVIQELDLRKMDVEKRRHARHFGKV